MQNAVLCILVSPMHISRLHCLLPPASLSLPRFSITHYSTRELCFVGWSIYPLKERACSIGLKSCIIWYITNTSSVICLLCSLIGLASPHLSGYTIGISRFIIVLHFIVLHRCYNFYKLKARPSTSKRFRLALLRWSQTQHTISPRYAYNIPSLFSIYSISHAIFH